LELHGPEGEGLFHLWEESSVDERGTFKLLPIANGKRGNRETKKETEKAHIEIKRRLDEAKRKT
jgi:hypothetical protein